MRRTTLRDSARTRRQDLFLVQRIELPSTVSVGAYTLKVRVRDRASSAEAESNIPVEMLADATLVNEPVGAPVASSLGAAPAQSPTARPTAPTIKRPTPASSRPAPAR